MTTRISEIAPGADPVTIEANKTRQGNHLSSALPRRYRNATVSVPEVSQWVASLVASAVEDKFLRVTHGGTLLLLGPRGTGKTWQMWGAIRELVESGASVMWRYTTAPDLFAELRPRQGIDAEQIYDGYAGTGLLVIDDLGAEKASEWTSEYLFRLINRRWDWELPTLVASNVEPDEFSERFGERVTSRLCGMSSQVTMTGRDRRRDR